MEVLINKVVYITGGTKGIGFGVAKTLLNAGMRVAISGRNLKTVEQAAATLGYEGKVLAVESNVAILKDEEQAIAKILSKWGQLDVVLANAGVGKFAPIDQLSEADWNSMIDTNLTGAFFTLKASVQALKVSKGYYITLASLAGANFFAQGAGYNASKFGLVGFTQAAMLDLRPHGVKVSTIMPGSVATYFNDHIPDDKDAWKIQPEDIAKLVLDLLTMHPRTLRSKIEVRPSRPDLK